ncbi:MAG: SCO family protein [Ottowia sp.]|nr:SCO family protein [Ottowia sp.]
MCLALAGWGTINWLTHGFQVWTDEGARRLEVALDPVTVPNIAVDGPGIPATQLPQLLQDGRVTLANFIYTNCLTVCLSLGTVFQQVQADLQQRTDVPGNAGVRLLSISFDGGRDDPAALRGYGERFGADPAWWQMVRAPDAAEEQALLRRLGVVVIPDGRGDYEHNTALLVFDRRGKLIRIFDMEEQQLALNYARHLATRLPDGEAS